MKQMGMSDEVITQATVLDASNIIEQEQSSKKTTYNIL